MTKIGIVGLPNVGKSTLFNALLKKQQALAANYPFATIDPNTGIVEVPDDRLTQLVKIVEETEGVSPPVKSAMIEFVDIAGLVKGAAGGEGLGNQFLANIRETDAIVHVLRYFKDENVVRAGAVDPEEDLSVIRTELMLADLGTLEKQKEPKGKVEKHDQLRWAAVGKLREGLAHGIRAENVVLDDDEREASRELFLLTAKPELFVVNVAEDDLERAGELQAKFAVELDVSEESVVVMCAKIEAELVSLDEAERLEYLESLGVGEPGLDRLIRAGYGRLGLISFLTAGAKEVRAWTIRKGMTAPEAAGVIHTDFSKKFIKAKVCGFGDFVELCGWKDAAEKGKVRMEGKEYVMKDGDVVEFMIGS